MATKLAEIEIYLNLPRPVSAGSDLSNNAPPLQPSSPALLLIPDPDLPGLPPARRLLVLVPDPATSTELANRIWALAAPKELDVLFIGATWQGNHDYAMRRLLATLAAATRDSHLQVETRLVRGKNWLQLSRALWQPGDLVICHREQTIAGWDFRRRPLAEALVATLNAPVYVLTGFCPEPSPDRPGAASRLLHSLLPFLIIVGSFVLQAQITKSFTNWLYYPLMILSVIIEIGLLALWNQMSG
jgi:hypothetical protein